MVDIFQHIHQMAARVAKFVLRCIWDQFRGRGVAEDQLWYHSKERCWFPIGSPLWSLRSICTIRPQFTIEFLRRSNQRGGVTLGKTCEGWVDHVSQILTGSGETWGCRMQTKSCRYLLPFEHNARTWQAGRHSDIPWSTEWQHRYQQVTAMSPKNLYLCRPTLFVCRLLQSAKNTAWRVSVELWRQCPVHVSSRSHSRRRCPHHMSARSMVVPATSVS